MLRRPLAMIVRGFCMGAADVVPGVSGGTIALLLGIYERLIASIRAASSALGHALRLDRDGFAGWLRRVEWSFLVPLLAGIGLAILTLAHLLEQLLEEHPVQMAAAFFGLIAGSILVVWGMVGARDGKRAAIALLAALVTFVALGVREGSTEEAVAQVADPALLAFFGAGVIAICAMILPGISGSFILVLLGMYTAVIGAVNDREILQIAVFALGAVLGLSLFSQALSWLLRHHHDSVMALLVGLMAGSLRVLWPWPGGLESTALGRPDGYVLESLLLAAGAAAIVVVLSALGRRLPAQSRLPHGAEPPPAEGAPANGGR